MKASEVVSLKMMVSGWAVIEVMVLPVGGCNVSICFLLVLGESVYQTRYVGAQAIYVPMAYLLRRATMRATSPISGMVGWLVKYVCCIDVWCWKL